MVGTGGLLRTNMAGLPVTEELLQAVGFAKDAESAKALLARMREEAGPGHNLEFRSVAYLEFALTPWLRQFDQHVVDMPDPCWAIVVRVPRQPKRYVLEETFDPEAEFANLRSIFTVDGSCVVMWDDRLPDKSQQCFILRELGPGEEIVVKGAIR